MADGVAVTPGTGVTVATDDAGASGHVQIVKLAISTDGVATLIPSDATYGMDVDVTRIATGTNAIGRVGHDSTNVVDGRKVVSPAGTRVALATTMACKSVVVQAMLTNTGVIVVGAASTVIADSATRKGIALQPGDCISLPVNDVSKVGLDATVSGDGVTWLATT